MSELSPEQIKAMWPLLRQELQAARHVILGTHVNPDGDALGSLFAVSEALEQLGISHDAMCAHAAPRYLEFLPHPRALATEPSANPDLAVILDLEAMDRLGSIRPYFESAPRKVVIDHHEVYESPGDVRIISTKSPATSAIIADLFIGSELTITPNMATNLLTGILTDTGSFRYPNTTPHSMHVAADLLESGANLREINEAVYLTRPLPAVRLLASALTNLQMAANNQIAYTVLRQSDYDRAGATEEDTEGIVNELLAIDTVRLAAILRETKSGKVKISIRSQGALDTTFVARQFGGGGHINASGASSELPIDETARELVRTMVECLASS